MILNIFLRQLSSIRSKKALEKEKTRRDYESLRIKLDGVSKQEKEAKENVKKVKFHQILNFFYV